MIHTENGRKEAFKKLTAHNNVNLAPSVQMHLYLNILEL